MAPAGTATSPDGRQWEVSTYRVRFPSWPESDYDPWGYSDDFISGVVAFVVAPFFWLVLPLVRVLLELPVAVGRSFFSPTRWVEARCASPSELRIVWRTSKQRAPAVAEHVVQELAKGYGALRNIDGAVLESMTDPPGVHDLDA